MSDVAKALAAELKRQNDALEISEDGLSVYDEYDNRTYDMEALVAASVDPHLALYETALRKLQKGVADFLHSDSIMTNRQLIDILLAVVADDELVRAMRGDHPPEQ